MASFLFRLIRVLIVFSIAGAAAFWLFSIREKPHKVEVVRTPPGVRVIRAVSATEAMTVEAFGTIAPRKKVDVAVEVAGRIDYIHPRFREGGAIKKDEVLIRIDQRNFRLDRDAARVRVEQAAADIRHLTQEIENLKADAGLAKTNMALSLKERDRLKALNKNQFASKTSLDKAEQSYVGAKIQFQSTENQLALTPSRMAQKRASLAMAKTDLAKAELILEKSEIRAGFDGFVLSKQAELGEYVNPGQVL
ncbi:MAG TPA: efflux RND transporter periplasmic adaptor subunit, partial [Desulfobacteraceae bacterium]|nr:efflux RND transporter periplasmic adaptor subunit [Desulfobacteraceae bacterium]